MTNRVALIAAVVTAVVVLLGLTTLLIVRRRRRDAKDNYNQPAPTKTLTVDEMSSALATNAASYPELLQLRLDANGLQIWFEFQRSNVWRAEYNSRAVAVRRMRRGDLHFAGEILAMSRLDSPHLVGLVGATWTAPGDLAAVMEFVDGPLRDLLSDSTVAMTWAPTKVAIALDIARGLAYLHSRRPKVFLRELTSRHVLVSHDRTVVKLNVFQLLSTRERELTARMADMAWMAPEVLADDKEPTEAADVYSLGVLLTELDTRKRPLDEIKAAHAKASGIVAGTLRPALSPSCPPAIQRIVEACLNHEPRLRPSSTKAMTMLEEASKDIVEPKNAQTAPPSKSDDR
ncbi:unnamed protein product [Aphanomyces euteiches]|uniref:Protein kinase domain-containing protein n=1 Tax=Aphanomyces euteiches TaxID=100861 RepID=A0A6G0WXV1_9STRA|nr:hypothetical protein Ae201684_010522 [Aphanomyces euteiches]KAH9090012.1 hypothetical protein Ae201684P_014767 [Aphanomyces euteiches]KAH9147293.1 hypothetical protein AeRB84_009059 [Aphanomyces euteiches]KAH9155468.1 hypothetical protein AeRB84_002565 [Aphanomyces euteiches]